MSDAFLECLNQSFDLEYLSIGAHVDFVVQLRALVGVLALAVLRDEQESRHEDRLDGDEDSK